MNHLSVVIPTLNEAGNIARLLEQLARQQNCQIEVIVADGGSIDDTARIAREFGATVLVTSAGRGHQMNAGVAAASNDLLLFLHADSRLTSTRQLQDAIDTYREVCTHSTQPVAGHFALQFLCEDPQVKARLRFYEIKTAYNRPATFNGDQGLLITRAWFEQMGSFGETLGFLEDQTFARQFNPVGRFITLPHIIETSGRRFEQEGVTRRILVNTIIMTMFYLQLDGFFASARHLYREQSQTSALQPAPFFQLVLSAIHDQGFIVAVKRWYQVGQFTAENFWQVFLNFGGHAGVRWHDKYMRGLINNFAGYTIAATGAFGWFITAWMIYLVIDFLKERSEVAMSG